MDELVNQFCNQMAQIEKNRKAMHSFYLFGDKRPGTILERFDADAKDWVEFTNLTRRGNGN